MNYEKLYKEALERARKIHNDTEFDYEKGMMEEIFPELAESEAEKIRKRLYSVINDIGGNVLRPYHLTKDEVLKWLEKQGEQVNCPQNLQVPNGGIVLEDFNGGEGNFKINLAFLNKKQVEEIENIVDGWNNCANTIDDFQKINRGIIMNEYLYNHDMCHCNQDKCSKKDECYRFWLGIDLKNHNFQYAPFYMPKNEQDLNECKFFIDKEYYKL